MAARQLRKQQITNYLLGELSEEEREDFERDFFESDDLAAEVLAAEERLMEDYVSGILDPARKKQFEDVYLADPALRNEVKMHKSLRSMAPGTEASVVPLRHTIQRLALPVLAACLVFFAVGLFLLFRENNQLRKDIGTIQSTQEQLLHRQVPPTAAPVPQSSAPRAATSLPAIMLVPGTREAVSNSPVIRATPETEAFVLEVDSSADPNRSYRAAIQNVDGTTLFEAGPLRAATGQTTPGRIRVYVPGNQLEPGDYILLLQDWNAPTHKAGEYYFRLAR